MAGTSLSDRDYGLVQRHLAGSISRLLMLELSMTVEHDFNEFAALRRSFEDGFVYPTFDPALCNLRERAFWLRITDRDGSVVAVHASRIFQVERFFDLMRNERIWGDLRPRMLSPGYRFIAPLEEFGGTVGHTGGLWVSPTQRGRGLASLLPAIARDMMLRNHEIEHDTALVFEAIAASGMPARIYGYSHAPLCVDGYFPPARRAARVHFCYLSRAEALVALAQSMEKEHAAVAA